jgi:putative SOS response-associated peptidase YedK
LAKFNARAETVSEKRSSAKLANVIVALIPISGYYEWQDTPGAKQPWYFMPRDGSPRSTLL